MFKTIRLNDILNFDTLICVFSLRLENFNVFVIFLNFVSSENQTNKLK